MQENNTNKNRLTRIDLPAALAEYLLRTKQQGEMAAMAAQHRMTGALDGYIASQGLDGNWRLSEDFRAVEQIVEAKATGA